MGDIVDSIEHYKRVIRELEQARTEGNDYEAVYEGDPAELPEDMPASFMVPWEKIPVVLPALRENLMFQQQLLEGLMGMAKGHARRTLWREIRPELDVNPDT
jgi:hypothetical protein